VNPDASKPVLAHAAEIRRRRIFADVEYCAFWKEEPSLRDAIFLSDPKSISEVYVVPIFISEGYFTRTAIPRELELNGRITKQLPPTKVRQQPMDLVDKPKPTSLTVRSVFCKPESA
jgi:sirohydrochlorin cobaltochelatase